MSGIKPNNFPQAPLPLTGQEEAYSQANNINSKYTVENIKDYVLTFLSGSTDSDWVKDINGVYNITDNIGIGTSTPSETLDVLGTHQLLYNSSFGDINQKTGFDSSYKFGFIDVEYIRWKFNSMTEECIHEFFIDEFFSINMQTYFNDANTTYQETLSASYHDEYITLISNNSIYSGQSHSLAEIIHIVNADFFGDLFSNFITIVEDSISLEVGKNATDIVNITMGVIGDGLTGLNVLGCRTYADDAVAGAAGLITGDIYKTATGVLMIKL